MQDSVRLRIDAFCIQSLLEESITRILGTRLLELQDALAFGLQHVLYIDALRALDGGIGFGYGVLESSGMLLEIGDCNSGFDFALAGRQFFGSNVRTIDWCCNDVGAHCCAQRF